MFRSTSAISVVIAGLCLCSSALGGMMQTERPDLGNSLKTPVVIPSDRLPHQKYALTECLSFEELESLLIDSTENAGHGTQETSSELELHAWSNGPGSFDLCLCALAGLGFIKTAPKVKQLSTSVLPDWYHDGAPLQIRNACALDLDGMAVSCVCCLVQPDRSADEQQSPKYQRGTFEPLLRKSLFTPGVLAPRGPPNMS